MGIARYLPKRRLSIEAAALLDVLESQLCKSLRVDVMVFLLLQSDIQRLVF